MGDKFAFIEYSKNKEMPLYGKNQLKLETAQIAGEKGYRAMLPVTENDAVTDSPYVVAVFDKAVETLKNYEVDIILPPKGISLSMSKNAKTVSVANGKLLFPFFLVKCLKWIYKKKYGSQDISHINVLTAGAEQKLTELTINCLAEEVNYLTATIPQEAKHSETEWLYNISDELLFETGVTLAILENGRDAYQNADIIVNLKNEADRYENVFKENAIYADISQNEIRMWDIARRRTDVTVFDGLRLRLSSAPYTDICMALTVFELFFYVKNPAYRQLTSSRGYDSHAAAQVRKAIDRLNPKISALYRSNKTIM